MRIGPTKSKKEVCVTMPTKKAMSIEKLLEAVQNRIITEEDIKKLNERLAQAEKRFEEEDRMRTIGLQKLLSFQYTV